MTEYYEAERVGLPPAFSERELDLWEDLWAALLVLAGDDVTDDTVLANARTAHGPVVVTAGLVRRLQAARKADKPLVRGELPPGGPGGHVKYLDEMLRERCIVCLERWPCTEVIHER